MSLDKVGKNILVYGTGAAGKKINKILDENNLNYTNCSSFGTDGSLKFMDLALDDFDSIIIASQFVLDILSEIKKRYFEEKKIFVFDNDEEEIYRYSSLRRNTKKNTLNAIYDLEVNPASFDVCVFANAAEKYRIDNGYDSINFIVIPPFLKQGRLCDVKFYQNGDDRAYRDRVKNIVFSVFDLIPSCISYCLLPSRENYVDFGNTFPEFYDVNHPKDSHNPVKEFSLPETVEHFEPTKRAIDYISQFIDSKITKPYITVTLREYIEEGSRNNDLSTWVSWLNRVRECYDIVIVRDTSHCGNDLDYEFDKYISCPVASMDIPVRLALYEKSYVNIFCNNGPILLCAFNKNANYIVHKLLNKNLPCADEEYFKNRFNMEVGDKKYPWSNPDKVSFLNWDGDSLENLNLFFEKYSKNISDAYGR